MSPKLSVLVITYNHGPYIAKALESILCQKTNFLYEIVIGEDCSTDDTKKIIEQYTLQHPKLIKPIFHKYNVGAIRNAYEYVLSNCQGKYIAFLEGDDFWVDELKLQKQVDFLDSNPDYGLVHSDVNYLHENNGVTEYSINKLHKINVPEGYIFNDLIKPNPIFIKTATTCFRKELILKHFDYHVALEENWLLTDLALWMDLSFNSQAHYFDEVFATYRLLDESASRSKTVNKKFKFHQSVYKIKQYYCKKYNCNIEIKNKLLEELHRTNIIDGYSIFNKSLAKNSYNFLKQNGYQITSKEKIFILMINLKTIWRYGVYKPFNKFRKLTKKIVKQILKGVFVLIKDNAKRAKIYTSISKLIYCKKNEVEYDLVNKFYWIKSNSNYLLAVDIPYYNFSKEALYKFINQVYCQHYTPKPGHTIIDLGAGIGTETLFFSEFVGETGCVYSIEASPSSFNKLELLSKKNKFKNSLNFNCAITDYNGKIWIEETANFIENQVNKEEKGIEVGCFTLDKFVADNKIEIINFLKVNIEGAELPMLNGMNECINIVQNIAVSCHDFLFKEDKHIKTSIVKYLEKNNFQIIYNDTKNIVVDSWIYGKRIK